MVTLFLHFAGRKMPTSSRSLLERVAVGTIVTMFPLLFRVNLA